MWDQANPINIGAAGADICSEGKGFFPSAATAVNATETGESPALL